MSLRTKLFITCVLFLGAALTITALWNGEPGSDQWVLFIILTTLATAAHLFKALGPNHEAWHLHLIFFFAGVLLLSPGQFVLVVIVAHMIEWGKERIFESNSLRHWYIQPFNISVHIISGLVAQSVFLSLSGPQGSWVSQQTLLAAGCAAAAYIVINHAFVGQALVWARVSPGANQVS